MKELVPLLQGGLRRLTLEFHFDARGVHARGAEEECASRVVLFAERDRLTCFRQTSRRNNHTFHSSFFRSVEHVRNVWGMVVTTVVCAKREHGIQQIRTNICERSTSR